MFLAQLEPDKGMQCRSCSCFMLLLVKVSCTYEIKTKHNCFQLHLFYQGNKSSRKWNKPGTSLISTAAWGKPASCGLTQQPDKQLLSWDGNPELTNGAEHRVMQQVHALGHSGQLSWLCPHQLLAQPGLLTGSAELEQEEASPQCKHCSAAAKTLAWHQHCISHKSDTQHHPGCHKKN